jgi:hypothetical protein
MTYDPPEAAVLLYNVNVNIPETWSWDGANWTLKASGSNNPTPSRGSALMTFDPTTRHIVMFGGFTPGGGDVNIMWSWTGQRWTNLGIDAPLRSLRGAAAGDPDRHALLGYEDGPAETWAWDGVQWTQLNPPHEPTATAFELFANPKGHQVLLLGRDLPGNAIQIFAWSGADWKQLA